MGLSAAVKEANVATCAYVTQKALKYCCGVEETFMLWLKSTTATYIAFVMKAIAAPEGAYAFSSNHNRLSN